MTWTIWLIAGLGLLRGSVWSGLPRMLPKEAQDVPKSYVFRSWAANRIDVDAVTALAAKAPKLPEPTGAVVRVSTISELRSALETAPSGTTIFLADGVYHVTERLWIRRDGIALRGASGDREKVILDGSGGGDHDDMVVLRGAKDVLIADLTVRNCEHYGILLYGDSDIQRPQIYNVKFHNVWTRGVKGTHPARIDDRAQKLHSPEMLEKIRPGEGSIRYCLFVNDAIKANGDDGFRGDYVAGIDMMGLKDWVIADNVFVGIRGKNGRGRGAIFVWVDSRGVVAERNIFVDCDRSIAYGNPSGEDEWHMTGGIVRNNVVVNGRFSGIEIIRTRDTVVYNNSVWGTNMAEDTVCIFQRTEGGRLYNNFVHGWVHCPENLDRGGNVVGDLTGRFVNPEIGDLRLTAKATAEVGQAVKVDGVTEDFLGRPRPSHATIGAFEPSAAPADAARACCGERCEGT